MDTPIYDFLRRYDDRGMARFHMPGHKGTRFLGCENLDITEVHGGDALYEASGIIARSEENAAALYGTQRTCFSTEGSSQCIRAMLCLALTDRPANAAPVIVAARNVHKAFVYAAALLDAEVVWLRPEKHTSLCRCEITAEQLEETLAAMDAPPAAVYVTSPDYLGGMADIRALAEVAHRHGTVLAVDNAHGAYLRFLQPSLHPLDLGADLCCDSAHKTLPVLTGGAYLHIAKSAPAAFAEHAKAALALFGSTSPSYLIMASLDLCNRVLAEGYGERLRETAARLDAVRRALAENGWQTEPSDPLRLTIRMPGGVSGVQLSRRLCEAGVECEYADDDFLVLMVTPENREEDMAKFLAALGKNTAAYAPPAVLPATKGERACSIRRAVFAPHETVPAAQALGRICGAPTVSCPPAIPIVISGEKIDAEAVALFARYGIESVDVLR